MPKRSDIEQCSSSGPPIVIGQAAEFDTRHPGLPGAAVRGLR